MRRRPVAHVNIREAEAVHVLGEADRHRERAAHRGRGRTRNRDPRAGPVLVVVDLGRRYRIDSEVGVVVGLVFARQAVLEDRRTV